MENKEKAPEIKRGSIQINSEELGLGNLDEKLCEIVELLENANDLVKKLTHGKSSLVVEIQKVT